MTPSRRPARRAALDGWKLSRHALDRTLQRLPDVDDLRAALCKPTTIRTRPDGCRYQEYGSVGVVLNVAARRIVTVVLVEGRVNVPPKRPELAEG